MSNIGAVIIANNSEKFNYVQLAEECAKRVKYHLNIPIAIISEHEIQSQTFDKVIHCTSHRPNQRLLGQNKYEWKNLDRIKAYELSPWDRTLLLDADLFINSNALKNHLNTTFDFAIARTCYDPTTGYDYVQKLGKTSIDQVWATLMIFNKSDLANKMFMLAEHVLDHWDYYHKLYNFNSFPLRNDYAFSIACHLLGGYGNTKFDLANYKLTNCDFNTKIKEIKFNNVLVSYKKQHGTQIKNYVQRIKSDVHMQDKISLFENI